MKNIHNKITKTFGFVSFEEEKCGNVQEVVVFRRIIVYTY